MHKVEQPTDVFRPGAGVVGRPRLTAIALPPYSYVPGRHPHPVSDPAGHMVGRQLEDSSPLDPDDWMHCQAYREGIDLFNHGYYWEAHEAWEGLWHRAGRHGPVADFLKGLIKLAAAAVKVREGNPQGVRRHAHRAGELFMSVADRKGEKVPFAGFVLAELIEMAQKFDAGSKTLATEPSDTCLLEPLPPVRVN